MSKAGISTFGYAGFCCLTGIVDVPGGLFKPGADILIIRAVMPKRLPDRLLQTAHIHAHPHSYTKNILNEAPGWYL